MPNYGNSPQENHTHSRTYILVHTGTCTVKGKHTPKVFTGTCPRSHPNHRKVLSRKWSILELVDMDALQRTSFDNL